MNFCFDHWELEDKTREETHLAPTSSSSKVVKYAKTCAVVLIPSREEYFNAGIVLWYDSKELKLSQYQASIELKHVMEENPVLTIEAAMTYLYQPKIDILHRNVDHWFTSRKLNLLVIDKSTKNANDTINDVITSQPRWQWSATSAESGDAAIKMIKNGSHQFDIVLVDESIDGKEIFNLKAIVTIFRSVFGDSVFIGCTVNDQFDSINAFNCTVNSSKKEALSAGCDFVWKKPISKFTKMLPLLLATRNKVRLEGSTPTGNASPKPPTRNRSSERSLASLDGLPDTDEENFNGQNEEFEDSLASRIKKLMKFHGEFELKEEFLQGPCPSIGLEIDSILDNVHIRDYKDLVRDDKLGESRAFSPASRKVDSDTSENNEMNGYNSDTNNDSNYIDNKSDTSDGSGSTTGYDSVTSIESHR